MSPHSVTAPQAAYDNTSIQRQASPSDTDVQMHKHMTTRTGKFAFIDTWQTETIYEGSFVLPEQQQHTLIPSTDKGRYI